MSERTWFTASGDKQDGPFSDSQLSALLAAGSLTQDTFVWTEGMAGLPRAGDTPGFIFSGYKPPPGSSPRPGGPPRLDRRQGGDLSADFGVWALFGRFLLLVIGTLLVVPAPWVFTSFYRWAVAHVHVPQRPALSFTGQVGDIWWVFVLSALSSYAGATDNYYLPLLLIPLQAALTWLTIRWVMAHISSEGHPLQLRFGGDIWAYIGWAVFFYLSFITIIGWAWVATAWMRWLARHIEGTIREVVFNASGWQLLWRTVVLVLACLFIIPIPWMMHWYACWFVAQFSVEESLA